MLHLDPTESIPVLDHFFSESARRHRHLCPRQVLGVRMGVLAGKLLKLDLPQVDKRLYCFVESDGCLVDGIAIASGCSVGRRSMHILDHGKMAATFVDLHTGEAMRLRPSPAARLQIDRYAPQAADRWNAYLQAYQVMPDGVLLLAQPVRLLVSMQEIISTEEARAVCERCGEEIFNAREAKIGDQVLCRGCAGMENYWESI